MKIENHHNMMMMRTMMIIRPRFECMLLVLAMIIACYSCHATLIKYDNEKLSRGIPHIEIHSIGPSGGYVDLEELDFIPDDDEPSERPPIVDVLFFQVPDTCQNSNLTSCDWLLEGIGIEQPVDDASSQPVAFCCTKELFDAEECDELNRIILDTFAFNGNQQYVILDDGSPKQMRDSYMDVLAEDMEVPAEDGVGGGGSFALLLINCADVDDDNPVTVSGGVRWESYTKDPSPFESLKVADDLQEMAKTCGIAVDYFNDDDRVDDNPDAYIADVEEYLTRLAETCTDEQVTSFNQAFGEFNTCAGFNLKEFIEDFPSAMAGTVLECIITTNWSQVEDWMDPREIASIEFSEACLDFEFGPNAFGYVLRHMVMFPDLVLPCFKDFAPKVPECALQTKPIPIMGGLLKQAACMAGELPRLLDDMLKIEMGIWNVCLPVSGGADVCENNCIYEGSILIRGGNLALPVSDAMERIANEENDTTGKFKSALQRYNYYLKECTDVWDGWKDYENEKYNINETPSVATSSQEQVPSSQQRIPQKAISVIWLFVGVLVGVGLTVVCERRRNRKRVALTENAKHELELTESAAAAAARQRRHPAPPSPILPHHDHTESSSDGMVDEII